MNILIKKTAALAFLSLIMVGYLNCSSFHSDEFTSANQAQSSAGSADSSSTAAASPSALAVYPGCETPPTSYTRTITVTDLQTAFTSKTIQPGDHVIVTGSQGQLTLTQYNVAYLANNTQWIWIDGTDATFSGLDVRSQSRLYFSGMTVTGTAPSAGNFVHVADGSQLLFNGLTIFTPGDITQWTVKDWLNLPSGFSDDNGTCIGLISSNLSSLRNGAFFSSRGQTPDATSIKGLLHNVTIRNISADFSHPIGSDITFSNNHYYDGYVSQADGDGNHDDFVQGFAYPAALTGGNIYTNVQILNNWFQETTNPDRAFQAPYQGIDMFDGVYDHLVIKGNVIISSAYWGCCGYAETNSDIEENTWVSINPNHADQLWVSVGVGKQGQKPINNVIKNNVAMSFWGQTGSAWTNNIVVSPTAYSSAFVNFDLTTMTFDLTPRTGGPLDGKGAGAF